MSIFGSIGRAVGSYFGYGDVGEAAGESLSSAYNSSSGGSGGGGGSTGGSSDTAAIINAIYKGSEVNKYGASGSMQATAPQGSGKRYTGQVPQAGRALRSAGEEARKHREIVRMAHAMGRSLTREGSDVA